MSAFDKLLEQIDAFIRKYYKNEMIKGVLLFVVIFLVSFLFTTSLEYFGRFGSVFRGFLFFSFIVVNLFVLSKYIIIPVSKLFSLGKKIDRYQASEIIGKFFPTVSDRLLNTLQLNDSLNQNEGNFELIRASVSQRSSSLSVIPFSSAINIKENNKKYIKYLIPLFLLLFGLAVFLPHLLTQGTDRVVNYTQEFKPIAPFDFVLLNKILTVNEGEDLEINVGLKGTQFPDKIYLVSSQGKFLMKQNGKNLASGVLKKIQANTSFYFEGNDFTSSNYLINVHQKSTIGKLQATLVFPSYLGREKEIVSNAGDMSVPEGTFVEWSVLTINTSSVKFSFNNKAEIFKTEGFKVEKKILNPVRVQFELTNSQTGKIDSSGFNISTIRDAHPSILVDEKKDSVADGLRYFVGSIADDYGLSSLKFVYTIQSDNGKKRENSMSVTKVVGTEMPFDFAVDFRRENVKMNDKIEYYFVVYDNDGVHGNKATKSQSFTYKLPSLEELNEKREEEQEATKESLSDILKRTEDFQKNVDRLKKEMLNSKSKDFNKLNQVQQLQEEQKSLQKMLEKMQDQMEQSSEEKNQLSEMDKEILEKQEMIDKLLDEVMDDELKDLLDKLEKLMENDNKNNKDEIKDKLEDIQMSSEQMKKQLDRSLEMLKKLQVNEKIDDIEKELKELAKEQDDLKKDIENNKLSKDKAIDKQEDLNKKFDDLKEKMKEMEKLNEALSKPMDLDNNDVQKDKITDDMKMSSEELGKGKDKKAGEKQKSAADEMEKMADNLDKMQKEANKKEQEEDINSLRSILENLMSLSFDQEEVMNKISRVKDTDPVYRKYGRKQRSIMDDTKVVKDSLEALAKRQPKIAIFIDNELSDISKNFALTIEDLDEHRRRDLGLHQQSVMTSFNNLALLLNEALQSMQNQMKSDSKGSGSCDNPGGKGKPKPGAGMNPGDMKEMLKRQLEQMEKGTTPNGKKPGSKEGEGNSSMSGGLGNKQIAKMAAEQTTMRQRLEQMKKDLNKDGKGSGNKLNPLLDELEKQERDLINKNFSSDIIKRQKNIMTRLLESEKALMERGFEEKRESKEGKNSNFGNQIRFDEYTKQKLNQIELLRSVDPVYKKYYKDKANEYFNRAN
jgi:hypothetical protein